jgi:hypothetical protein
MSTDLLSTSSNDEYSTDSSTDTIVDGVDDENEVGTGKDARGGIRLVNLVELNRVVDSTTCCKRCVATSHRNSMNAFIKFCDSKITKILSSCVSLSYHNEKKLRNLSVSSFYEVGKLIRKQARYYTKTVYQYLLWTSHNDNFGLPEVCRGC